MKNLDTFCMGAGPLYRLPAKSMERTVGLYPHISDYVPENHIEGIAMAVLNK